MKDIIILGSGGFAREVVWLLEENNKIKPEWNILGFVSDDEREEKSKYPILGNDQWLLQYEKEVSIACCIGNGSVRKKIIEKFKEKKNFHYPNLIADTVKMSESVKLGKGCIICAMSVLTVDIEIGDFLICNLDCTVGHDVKIDDYVTLNPSVNVSGNVAIGSETSIGTGCNLIQGITVGAGSTIGAGAVVVTDIPDKCTAVGVPAKVIKKGE